MNHLFQILIVFLIVGCKLNSSENNPIEAKKKTLLEDCLLKTYEQSYLENIRVSSIYYDCESDWKFQLQIQVDHNVIYKADTLLEYEFKKHPFPTYVKNENGNIYGSKEMTDHYLIRRMYSK